MGRTTMTAATNPPRADRGEPDLRLPDHRQELRPVPPPLRVIGAAAGAVGGAIIALVYLVAAPLIALATGAGQILMEVRDNAVRPRPFTGARHGFPFLDPPPPAPAQPVEADETEH
jgi:hypothetical protein